MSLFAFILEYFLSRAWRVVACPLSAAAQHSGAPRVQKGVLPHAAPAASRGSAVRGRRGHYLSS